MKFLRRFEIFKKNSKTKKSIQDMIDKLPENEQITKEILQYIGNNTTQLEIKTDIKNSYYVYLNDKIYLSNRKKTKTSYTRLCLIAHECIHSMQSKILQSINFLISNVEIISFCCLLIIGIFNKQQNYMFWVYLILIVLAIIFRTILEFNAVVESVSLSKRYLQEKKVSEEKVEQIISIYRFQTILLMPMFFLNLYVGKIIRLIIIYIIIFS